MQQRRWLIPLTIVGLAILIVAPVFSQSNIQTLTQYEVATVEQAQVACQGISVGELCVGDTGILIDNNTVQGVIPAANATTIVTDAGQIATIRLQANLPADTERGATLLVLENTELSDVTLGRARPTCDVTNLTANDVDLFAQPTFETAVLEDIAPNEVITVNGKTADGAWYRSRVGAVPGWVSADRVAIDCDPATLIAVAPGDIRSLYNEQFTATNLASGSVIFDVPLNGVGHILVNNVAVSVSGTVHGAVTDDALTLTGVSGQATITTNDITQTLRVGEAITITNGIPSDVSTGDLRDLPALTNALVHGQSPSATLNRLAFDYGATRVAEGQAVPLTVDLRGDLGTCDLVDTPAVDLVIALDVSPTLTTERAETLAIGIEALVSGLDSSDQIAVILFNDSARAIQTFEDDLETVGLATRLEREIDANFNITPLRRQSNLDAALASARTQLNLLPDDERDQPVVLVVSDSAGYQQNNTEITFGAGTRTITVAYETGAVSEALNATATNPTDAYTVPLSDALLPTLAQIAPSLKQIPVATDIELRVEMADAPANLLMDAATYGGGTVDGSAVVWTLPALYAQDVVSFPVGARASGDTLGNVSLSYTGCTGEGRVSETIPLPNPTTTDNIDVLAGDARGTIRPLGTHLRTITPEAGETFVTVEILDTEATTPTLLGGGLLYTTEPPTQPQRTRYVYNVPAGETGMLILRNTDQTNSTPYTLLTSTGASLAGASEITVNGDPVDGEGNGDDLFLLDGATDGDTLTVSLRVDEISLNRLSGLEAVTAPLSIVNFDGTPAAPIFARYDPLNSQWISLFEVGGESSFLMNVAYEGRYRLEVQSGDRVTGTPDPIPLGQQLAFQDTSDEIQVKNYRFEVPQDGRINVLRTGPTGNSAAVLVASRATVLNADNRVVPPVSSRRLTSRVADIYDLTAGQYTLLLQTQPSFELSITRGELEQNVRGTVVLEETVFGETPEDAPFALYELAGGSVDRLTEGDIVTVNLEDEAQSVNNLSIRGANNEPAEVVNSLLTLTTFRLNGAPPYTIAIEGLPFFEFNVTRDNLLNVDRGPIFFDQTIRDSTALPSFVTYDLTPAIGKSLLPQDVVTIRYEGPRRFESAERDRVPVPDPQVIDKNGAVIPSIPGQTYRRNISSTRRELIRVYQLDGTPPFRLSVPNEESYVITFESGNTFETDAGQLLIDTTVRGRTSGPQLVTYDVLARAGETFTLTLSQVNADFISDVRLEGATEVTSVGTPFSNARLFVFEMQADGPQRLEFLTNGTYAITTEPGDQITEDRGIFFLGDAETVEIEEGPKLVRHQLEITEPQRLSIQIDRPNFDFIGTLYGPDGDIIGEDDLFFAYDDTTRRYTGDIQTYTLGEPGTYELRVQLITSGAANYRLTALPDTDVLTLDKGNFFLDTSELDTLPRNVRYANYTINGDEGDTITVEVTNETSLRQRDRIANTSLRLVNADGEPISQSERLGVFDGQYTATFVLDGPGPYQLELQPDRPGREDEGENAHEEYGLAIFNGNTLRTDRGTLISGFPVTGTVEESARRVVYQIDPRQNPGDIITIRLGQDGEFASFLPVLRNAEGNRIDTLFSNRFNGLAVYELEGEEPYTLTFDLRGNYEIELTDANLLVQDFGPLAVNPAEPVIEVDDNGSETEADPLEAVNRLEEPAIIARYTLDVAPGQTVTIEASQLGEEPGVSVEDADGLIVSRLFRDEGTFVYAFAEGGTYTVFVGGINNRSDFTVRVTESNLLFADSQPPIPLNPAEPVVAVDENGNESVADPLVIENTLENLARVAFHPLEVSGGTTITLETSQQNRSELPTFVITDDNLLISPSAETTLTDGTLRRVYELPEDINSYQLALEPSSAYTVQLTAEDQIRTTGAVVPIGQFEEPFTNELEEPFEIVTHRLAPLPGRVLTLQLSNANRAVNMALSDGNGEVLTPLVRDLVGGSNYEVYLVSGEPPFSVTFQPQGSYELVAEARNLLLTDQGIIPFGQELSDQVEAPSQAVEYTIDGRRNQLITTQVAVGGLTTEGDLRDANGRLWEPIITTTSAGQRYDVYLLGGPPPYEFVFNGQTTYNITVEDTDIVTDLRGAVTFGEEIRERVTGPAQIRRYLINGTPGQQVSVNLQVNGQPAQPTLFDNDGELLIRLRGADKQARSYTTYTLTGPEPYVIEFTSTSAYSLTVTEGDVLTQPQEPLVFDERRSGSFASPVEVGVFPINANAGQTITVQAQVNSQPTASVVRDSNGNEQEPITTFEKLNSTFTVYRLTGQPPYELVLDSGQSLHNITLRDGNALLTDQGFIRFGNTETETLEQPAELALYSIDAQPGDEISLAVTASGRAVESEVRAADGSILQPRDRVLVSGTAYTSYVLTGPPPYQVNFAPAGRYSLTLERGDFTIEDQGIAAFGDTVRERLTLPQSVVRYSVNTAPNQEISIEITDTTRRDFFPPTFVDANGVNVPVLTEVLDQPTRKLTVVYSLLGTTGPYTLTFEPEQATYEFALSRGDVTLLEDQELGQ